MLKKNISRHFCNNNKKKALNFSRLDSTTNEWPITVHTHIFYTLGHREPTWLFVKFALIVTTSVVWVLSHCSHCIQTVNKLITNGEMEDAKHRTAWQHPDNRGSYNQSDVAETIFFNGDQKKEHVLNHTMLTGRQWSSLFYSSISVLHYIQFRNKCVGPLWLGSKL